MARPLPPPDEPVRAPRLYDRREFITLTGAAGASVYLGAPQRLLAAALAGPPAPNLSFTWSVRRREDFLSLTFYFYNLEVAPSANGPVLKRTVSSQPSVIVVEFPPQHVAEEAFREKAVEFGQSDNDAPPLPGSVESRLAKPSRLAFNVGGNPSIPFTFAGLLDWLAAGLSPRIVPLARTVKPATAADLALRRPEEFESAIEVPWRLLLSPNERSAWAHATEPVTSPSGRTEVWHTRLGVRSGFTGHDGKPIDDVDEAPGAPDRTLRAVWTRDWDENESLATQPVGQVHPTPPFPTRLDATDRAGIVRATSDYGIKRTGLCPLPFTPSPVRVNELMLTAMGAWVDLEGVWDLPLPNTAGISLEAWRHRGTNGRDTYVRVVESGFLFPFRHRASIISVSERKFFSGAAYLRLRYFLLIRELVKTYGPGTPGQPHDGRGFPFVQARIKSSVTPSLVDPAATYLGAPSLGPIPGVTATEAWVPHLEADELFRFHLVVTDVAGQEHELTTPLVFVDGNAAFNTTKITAIVERYDSPDLDDAVRQGDLEGQAVSLAPSTTPGDTSVEVNTITFGAELGEPGPIVICQAPRLPFWPTMATANARLTGASQAAGKDVTTDVQMAPGYVSAGFIAGEVFATTATGDLGFDTNRSGGVVQPSFPLKALSRSLGPVGGATFGTNGQGQPAFKVADLLPDAKLLGGIKLKDIVAAAVLPAVGASPGDDVMQLTYETTPAELVTRLRWKPALTSDTASSKRIFEDPGDASLAIDARVATSRADPKDSTIEVHGDLRSFRLNLIGASGAEHFLSLDVNRFAFDTKNGHTTFDVDIQEVHFAGVLQFVNKLREVLDVGGGGGASPSIDATPTAITASFGGELPPLEVGVFALSNLRLAAGISIPYSGKPVSVRFALAEREDPFVLQVSFFAGGGFFAVAVNGDGVEKVEAAFEFGARCALDIGVASGSVELMAGIYFGYGQDLEQNVVTATLEGYVRLRGELTVIEIVDMSLTFELSLRYQQINGADKVVGRAEMTVTIEVLVFSGDVTLTVERRFGNGPNDPTFAQQLPDPSLWQTYANAFAEVPA